MASIDSAISDKPRFTYLRSLWERREFARYLVTSRLSARNASTALGLVWWVLNPLAMAFVYFIVFGTLFDQRAEGQFLSYLLVGVFAFQFTTQSMNGGTATVLSNAKLLVNIRFPRLILPSSAVAEALIGFLTALIAFFVLSYIGDRNVPGVGILLLPVVVAIQTVFNLGLSALFARLVVPFRDIGELVPHITRFWFYLTPIIWRLSLLEQQAEWIQWAARSNPMYSFIQLYRVALMGYRFEWADFGIGAAWAGLIGVVGIASFVRAEDKMVRYL